MLDNITSSPRSAARAMMPLAIAAKYGSPTSWQMTPTVLLEALARACAWAFGM
ncbi:hypothetical protein ACFVY1_28580 [Streptomyces sp. NPDC058293]|uniref:hypothetical protein n=1 Tax=Streptomyces sp. NPDC058293 TaxID=3346429 RepID=UPI0036E40A02